MPLSTELDRVDADLATHRPRRAGPATVVLPADQPWLAARTVAALSAVAATVHIFEPGDTVHPEVVRDSEIVVHAGRYPDAEALRAATRPDQLFIYIGTGINPVVLAAGADLDRAAADVVRAGVLGLGDHRLAPGPILAPATGVPDALAAIDRALAGLTPLPVTDPAAAGARLLRHTADIARGGNVDYAAGTVEPTVLSLPAGARLDAAPPIRPLLTVAAYTDPDALGNRLDTGRWAEHALGATVYGSEPALVAALGRKRAVAVDRSLDDLADDGIPVAGRGPMAGYAAYGGRLLLGRDRLLAVVAETLGRA